MTSLLIHATLVFPKPKPICLIFFPRPPLLYSTFQERLSSLKPPMKASALRLPLLGKHNLVSIGHSQPEVWEAELLDGRMEKPWGSVSSPR